MSKARTLVTHNRTDFEELVQAYFASKQMHYGVIFAVCRSPQEIAQRLLVILNQVTAEEMADVGFRHLNSTYKICNAVRALISTSTFLSPKLQSFLLQSLGQ